MKVLKSVVIILISTLVCACGSTSKHSLNTDVNTELKNGYYQSQFSHNSFSLSNHKTIKKSNTSDHHLMLSLLNRPMTEDRKMMLAFAKQRARYLPVQLAQGIQIKGDVKQDSNGTNELPYTVLIAQDSNAINIIAPN